jgi:hypothetical protein
MRCRVARSTSALAQRTTQRRIGVGTANVASSRDHRHVHAASHQRTTIRHTVAQLLKRHRPHRRQTKLAPQRSDARRHWYRSCQQIVCTRHRRRFCTLHVAANEHADAWRNKLVHRAVKRQRVLYALSVVLRRSDALAKRDHIAVAAARDADWRFGERTVSREGSISNANACDASRLESSDTGETSDIGDTSNTSDTSSSKPN